MEILEKLWGIKFQIFSPHQHLAANSSWAVNNKESETSRGMQKTEQLNPKKNSRKQSLKSEIQHKRLQIQLQYPNLSSNSKGNYNLLSLILKINNEIWINQIQTEFE